MLKKSIITIAILLSGLHVQACSVVYETSSNQVDSVISKSDGWAFDNYAVVCRKLNEANAKLQIKAQASVLDNKSIAYGSVSVMAIEAPVIGNSFGGTSIKIDSYASQDKAEALMFGAINNAINSMDIDKALGSLNEARKLAKVAYKK